jgi:hypothetical protein
MRIFHVAQTTPNEIGLPDSVLWRANLYDPLIDLGHDLVTFTDSWLGQGYCFDSNQSHRLAIIEPQRRRFSESLLNSVRHEHARNPIDLLFTYFSAAHVEPECIRDIRKLGIVTVNWYCNASYQFHLVEPIVAAYDYCLVPEKCRLDDYRRAGANPIYCQEAANPNVYRPCSVPEEFDVSFVGQCYGSRPRFVADLIDAGVAAHAWGPGWALYARHHGRLRRAKNIVRRLLGRSGGPPALSPKHCGPPLSDDELVKMYSRSRISLGFTAVAQEPPPGQPPIKQVRLRDFEATMSGACYLVEHCDELTEFFEPDHEIVCFKDETELVDKARYYLRHSKERQRLRAAALRRARAEHTWQARFRQVFQRMGLM